MIYFQHLAKIHIPKALLRNRKQHMEKYVQTFTRAQILIKWRHKYSSFDVTDSDWGSNSKPWIDGLNELGLKPVQEGHGVAYAVKCQHTCSVVQVHSYPGGVGAADGFVHPVVPGRVTWVWTQETPGFVIVAQETQWTFALSTDALVGHPDRELPTPLNLPVEAASRQGLSAQHLGKAVKPLRVVSIGLQLPGAEDFSAVFRDVQLLVGCAMVQFQLAKIYRQKNQWYLFGSCILVGFQLSYVI